jgi:hypothetical protein
MPLSTNSIIHYTDSYEKLESILKEGFAIKYCSEKLLLNPRVTSFAAHPMVSFCDVPLSQAYNHFDAYGNYGIGLSKTWANKMKINPVIYIDKNSLFGEVIGEFIIERRKTKSNLTVKQKQNILRIKCYAKNYSGYLKRKGIDDKNYRFYDEREWRLVPKEKDLNGASFSVSLKNYEEDKIKYNSKISSCRFSFNSNVISYIIVDKTNEIPKIINMLRIVYASKCTAQSLDILFSKICSTEQIISDY